jgi:hypothetical protein
MLLLIAFVVIQLLDVAMTAYGLKHGASEANMLPAFLMDRFGFWPAVLGIKLIGVALAVAATMFVRNGEWFTGVLVVIGLGVLIWNLKVLLEGRKTTGQ